MHIDVVVVLCLFVCLLVLFCLMLMPIKTSFIGICFRPPLFHCSFYLLLQHALYTLYICTYLSRYTMQTKCFLIINLKLQLPLQLEFQFQFHFHFHLRFIYVFNFNFS